MLNPFFHRIFMRETQIRVWCLLVLAVTCLTGCAPEVSAQETTNKSVKIVTKKEGDATRFFVHNLEQTEVTVTFEMELENLKGSLPLPYTATFPANATTEAFALSPIDAGAHWSFSFTSHYTIGSTKAMHDDAYVYTLPFEAGAAFRVTQGFNGTYSHTGADQYAIDFKMSAGTGVHAAREGRVVKIKDDSNQGGGDRKYVNCANYVLIKHSDGTIANYAHLAKGGARVKVGDYVRAGDLIAHSGSTGFSSGPHLHFSVFKTRDGKERVSIPVKFQTGNGSGMILAEGKTYKAIYRNTELPSPVIATMVPGVNAKRAEKPAQGSPTSVVPNK
ncbi:MAG: family peptidase [Verrucomicrobiales bacterium]|nr:family peptidase [Verrucomicrobiales bacterium]